MDISQQKRFEEYDFEKEILSFKVDEISEQYLKCNFFRADFLSSEISNKEYIECNFNNIDASQAIFTECKFLNCSFINANFSKVIFKCCSFIFDDSPIEYTSENYLDYESPFEKSSFAEAQFLTFNGKGCLLKNAFFKSVGFKYSKFHSVKLENVRLFSASFENALFENCTADMFDISNCSSSNLELASNLFEKVVIQEGKLFSIIGLDTIINANTLVIHRTNKNLDSISVSNTSLFKTFLRSSYEFFEKRNLIFEQVNTLIIAAEFSSVDSYTETISTKERLKQISLLFDNQLPIITTLQAIIENYAAKCIKNYISINTRNLNYLIKLLANKRIYDKHIYHSIMSALTYSNHQDASEISKASLMLSLFGYSQNIDEDIYTLKIKLPDSNLDNLDDIVFLTTLTNFLVKTANISEYKNIKLSQGSLLKYLSFVSKNDLKKVLFITFLLGAEIQISPHHWEFKFNLKSLIVLTNKNSSDIYLQKFGSDDGFIDSKKELEAIHNYLLTNKEKIRQIERNTILTLTMQKKKIQHSKNITNLFLDNKNVNGQIA